MYFNLWCLNIFDNFYALPYRLVESDIYDAIKDNILPSYTIKERSVERKHIFIV